MAQAATSGESQTANLAMSLVGAFFHLFTASHGLVFRGIFPYFFVFHFRSLVFLFNGGSFKRTVFLSVLSFSRIRLNYLMFRVDLSYSKKGNKTCAIYFATLL